MTRATQRPTGDALATAERCADLTLGSTEALYRTLVESCGELIVLIDDDGCLAFVNGACQELLGYERCEMLGRELGDFLALDAADWVGLAMARPANESIGLRRQLTATRKDGARLKVAFSAVSTGDHTRRAIVAVISEVPGAGDHVRTLID
jgi:PAS domain S-box-containing protein